MADQFSQPEIVLRYQAAAQQVRDRSQAYALALWASLGTYRDADIARFADTIVPQVLAAQRFIASLTDAYLAAMAGRSPIGVDQLAVTSQRGIAPDLVYRRPGVAVWTALSQDKAPEDAIAAGRVRLASLVDTDLQLAQRIQEQESLHAQGARFYRRVLTGAENCALCVIASTQRYHVGDLKPIHPGCDCGVAQLDATSDPGQIINARLLDAAHSAIEAKFGGSDAGARDLGIGKANGQGRPISDYTDLIVTRNHGEYGPTLAWRGDHFTGPGDLPELAGAAA